MKKTLFQINKIITAFLLLLLGLFFYENFTWRDDLLNLPLKIIIPQLLHLLLLVGYILSFFFVIIGSVMIVIGSFFFLYIYYYADGNYLMIIFFVVSILPAIINFWTYKEK